MELSVFLGKHKNKLLNIGVIVLALIFSNRIYKGSLKEIERLNAVKEEEAKKNVALSNISKLEKKINSYKNFFANKDAGFVIDTISGIARDAGIKIVSIRPVEKGINPDYVKFPFDLVINASSYHTVARFIKDLESTPAVYLSVENVNIQTSEFSGQKKGLSVTLRVSQIVLTD